MGGELLNNRELAILFWLLVGAVFAIRKPEIRSSFGQVLKTALNPVIMIPLFLLIIYLVGMVNFAKSLGFWEYENIKEAVLWFLGVGIVIFISAGKATRREYFSDILTKELKVAIGLGLWEYIANFYVFSLIVELVLIPTLFLLGGSLGYASLHERYKKVRDLLSNVISLLGIILISFVSYNLVTNLGSLTTLTNLREYLLPIIFTILSLPFFFLLALYLAYDRVFRMMSKNTLVQTNKLDYLRVLAAFNIKLYDLIKWRNFIITQSESHGKQIKDLLEYYKMRKRKGANVIKRFIWLDRTKRIGQWFRTRKRKIVYSILWFLSILLALLIAINFWRISEPIVYWTGLEAIVVTLASAAVIYEIRSFVTSQQELGAKGFVLFAEHFMGDAAGNDVRMLQGVLHTDEHERAQYLDVPTVSVLDRLTVAKTFIDRGLMDQEIMFISYSAFLRDAATCIRHIWHHPDKMPWIRRNPEKYKLAIRLLRDFEDWNSIREGYGLHDDYEEISIS